MARINTTAKATPKFTHEGAPAFLHMTAEQQLRRSVMSCMLWENEFYENGKTIADRIAEAVAAVDPKVAAQIAVEARTAGNLRHVPLLVVRELARKPNSGAADAIAAVIQRPDEITELLAIYWATNKGKKTLPAAFKKGIAKAFGKFGEYSLAKYDRDGKVKLRDAMRLVHPKPGEGKADLYKKVIDRTLQTPDTWEVALSGGADKKETFERLIREGNLGYLALLRNLRNMAQANVPPSLVHDAILARKNGAERVLPFRFVAAARAAPQFEKALDKALLATIASMPKLEGSTVVLVDVSGSMDWALSTKSDLKRIDAACALASLIDGDVRVFSFSDRVVEVAHRLGMAGVDAIRSSQPHAGTRLGAALAGLPSARRLIVITDEQSHDKVNRPEGFEKVYMINVASNQNGVGYGDWVHIDGFSESVLKFIHVLEQGL